MAGLILAIALHFCKDKASSGLLTQNAQEEQGHRAMAEALAMKAWKELEAAPAEPASAGQPVKPVRLTTCLGPAVRQCATVSTVCATAGSMVTGPVSASLRTGAPGVTNPSLSVRPCSARRTPDAHLPAKTELNSNANAFPITKATANTASSHCECKEHYRDFVPGVGCSMINVCESNNPCHKNANCSTVAPGQARTYAWPLSNLGPFTVLLPSDKGLKGFNVKELLMDNEAARYFVKLHIIAGQMSTRQMNDTDTFYTLTGKSGEIFNRDKLEVATLISTPHIRTMANQFVKFNITRNGRILVNDVAVEETEVAAKNGRIYMLTGVLVPPSIVPILPHRCDATKREMRLGTCVSCSLIRWSKCPANSEPMVLFTRNCVYKSRTGNLKSGCAQYCNATMKIPKCCSGFFGPDCNPCPGGFLNPCSGNGQCIDGLSGNGTCICEDGFQGSRCQFCSDPNRYGPRCNRTCLCVHGACDNRIDSDGACLSGTCREGTSGRFCDKKPSACGPFVQLCHIHATCEYSDGTASCVCNEGYEGDGTLCSKKDPCVGSTSRGGCSPNAECIRTGTGAHVCVCQQGWTGDGRDCVVINNCLLPGRGGCHDNATCLYVGPGQVVSFFPYTVVINCSFIRSLSAADVKMVSSYYVAAIAILYRLAIDSPHGAIIPSVFLELQNECECKKGFRGNGIDCESVISCLEQAEKCHPLATCQADASGVWSCVCQEGYEGNGLLCYGNVLMDASLQSMLSATPNLTVLVPSRQAIEDMDKNERTFWLSRNNMPALIKYHTIRGTYGGANLQNLSSSDMLATSLQGSFLHLDKADGLQNITIEGASIVDGDNAATNGVIHVINK
ncbi:hypothetical protein U0070_001421, partial [Myodes glareolus]